MRELVYHLLRPENLFFLGTLYVAPSPCYTHFQGRESPLHSSHLPLPSSPPRASQTGPYDCGTLISLFLHVGPVLTRSGKTLVRPFFRIPGQITVGHRKALGAYPLESFRVLRFGK